MKNFKIALRIIATLPILFFVIPLALYYEITDKNYPKWLDWIGHRYAKFLESKK